MRDIAIVGGGLSGLINAIMLARAGKRVVLFERKRYPFHRVCGEYISNEVAPFLKRNDLFPEEMKPPILKRFLLTSVNGRSTGLDLDMGGFGISRFYLDEFLYQKALEAGVECHQQTTVTDIQFVDECFIISHGTEETKANIVIAAYGKRSILDKKLNRPFMSRRSPYAGVKYHIKTDFADDTIALHNFKDGYCGISKIEGEAFNLCYLTHNENIKRCGSIEEMEREILYENPFLKTVFENADFLFEKPIVINEINFEKKAAVENHILMSGDAAGMITPLCGNGMAMAIHSAKVLSELIINVTAGPKFDRKMLEENYTKAWNELFARRLLAGRKIQGLFGSTLMSNVAVNLAKIKPVANALVNMTHGRTF